MQEAQFILLDEPTAALDAETESRLIQLLTHLKTGRTSLLISHRFSTVKLADQIVVMEDGQICEQGTHAQLMMGNGLYARMYTTQAGLYQHDPIAQAFV